MEKNEFPVNDRCRHHYVWSLRLQGNLCRVYRQPIYNVKRRKKKRGKIYGFSSKARLRMLCEAAKIDWDACGQCSFITLTYPDLACEQSYKARTIHRFIFHRYLEKYYGCHVPTIWRIEWKPRQTGIFKGLLMPHIHIVVIGLPCLSRWRIQVLWRKTLSYGNYINVHSIDLTGPAGAAKYISKYVSKPDALGIVPYVNKRITPGKAWAMTRREEIPRHRVSVCRILTDDEIEQVQGLAELSRPNYDPRHDGGFVLFGPVNAKIIGYWYGKGIAEPTAAEYDSLTKRGSRPVGQEEPYVPC